MRAKVAGIEIANSEETIAIEGNQYFPPQSINQEYFTQSSHTSSCPWKGEAHYYNIEIDGELIENGAWYYPEPKEGAPEVVGKDFSDYVAFYTDKVELTP